MSIWSDIWNNISLFANASQQNYPGIATTLPATPEGQQVVQSAGFFGAVTGFLEALVDPSTWRSVAWILLGVVLLITGIVLWLRDAGVIPNAVPVPV